MGAVLAWIGRTAIWEAIRSGAGALLRLAKAPLKAGLKMLVNGEVDGFQRDANERLEEFRDELLAEVEKRGPDIIKESFDRFQRQGNRRLDNLQRSVSDRIDAW